MQIVRNWYGRRVGAWENELALRTTDRVVRPFEWGVEWSANWPCTGRMERNGHSDEAYLAELNRLAIEHSDDFFAYEPPRDFALSGNLLCFTSAVQSPYAANNSVHAQFFPAKDKQRAVVVLPHWNASAGQHRGLCVGLAKLGITALRLSLPYHDYRMPPELHRADYAVSSNIARTIDATRQAVIDTRSCFDWLLAQGYERIGLVGTSLGSCYAFLAAAHDERIRVNVFNHVSTSWADVVWEGLSTRHIRQGFENEIDLARLRQVWAAISPEHYMDLFARRMAHAKSLFIYATYDTTFPLHLSRETVAQIRSRAINAKFVEMPCGHYTIGEAPFKFIDGYHICSFLKRWL